MIPAGHLPPVAPTREHLADILGGTLEGEHAIRVDGHRISAGVTGIVSVDGVQIGKVSDGAEVLAGAYRRVVVGGAS